MKVNENIIKGKWLEIKGDIQSTWGKLTDNELEMTKGDTKAIQGLLQKKYGQTEESYTDKVQKIFSKFEDSKIKPKPKPKHQKR
jgi:uncharacterized protein YjbJ (UPF0337 family)